MRNKKNYPSIITKYSSYPQLWEKLEVERVWFTPAEDMSALTIMSQDDQTVKINTRRKVDYTENAA